MKDLPNNQESDFKRLDVQSITWSVLLARWMAFARSAVALPDDEQGQAMRQSVADIIALQAVWMALGELDELPADERALGIDRASYLIAEHGRAIESRYAIIASEAMPTLLRELIDDARARLDEVRASQGLAPEVSVVSDVSEDKSSDDTKPDDESLKDSTEE